MRERVRTYEKASFPNYPAPDARGYPNRVDVSRRLAIFSASMPDHYETFRPKLDNPEQADGREQGQGKTFDANEKYKNMPGAVLRLGNLSKLTNSSVHSGEDVVLTATGPGSERMRGKIDNTEVFRVMVEALGLGSGQPARPARQRRSKERLSSRTRARARNNEPISRRPKPVAPPSSF